MLGLIIKDFLQLKRILKALLGLCILYTLIAFAQDSPDMLVTFSVIICTISCMNSLMLDEHSKWNQYALTLPFDRTKLVVFKYVMLALLAAISCIIPFFFELFLSTSIDLALEIGISSFAGGILCGSLVMPFIYKFGAEKGRIILMVIVMLPFAATLYLEKSGSEIPMEGLTKVLNTLDQAPLLLIAGIFVFCLLSLALSVLICTKKEY